MAKSPAVISVSGNPRKARGGSAFSIRTRTPANTTMASVKPNDAAKPKHTAFLEDLDKVALRREPEVIRDREAGVV